MKRETGTSAPKQEPKSTQGPDPRESRLFRSLVDGEDNRVSVAVFRKAMTDSGLLPDDPRLSESLESLQQAAEPDPDTGQDLSRLDCETFCDAVRHNILLIERALQGRMVIPAFSTFCEQIEVIFKAVRENRSGAAADYIPQLDLKGEALDRFALALCTVDGQRFELGDVGTFFSVQSTTKPISYCMALEEHGHDIVHRYVGREPSGVGFNELTLDRNNRPHNPMINAGAIITSSLIGLSTRSDDTEEENGGWSGRRFEKVIDYWRQLCGGEAPRFSTSVFLSERETADRNFALAYMMREQGGFPKVSDLNDVLEFYFQTCSIELNTRMMAAVAGTLANGGICPIVGKRIFSVDTVRNCLSMMASSGMYDYSGEFAFRIGLPAKSGVSGALMVVVPNVIGFCTYSPRLDEIGNSARGVEFFQHLVNTFNFHQFDNLTGASGKQDPRVHPFQVMVRRINEMIWAASKGDIGAMQELVLRGSKWNCSDYDRRTPLHLAAAENQIEVVRHYIDLAAADAPGTDLSPLDRRGGTPLDDARQNGNSAIVSLLTEAGARKGTVCKPIALTNASKDQRMRSDQADELIWAASLGDLAEVRRLIALGVSPNVYDYDSRTPLHLAAAEGQVPVVRHLLRQGVATDAADRWGDTPLAEAMRHKHEEIVALLSENTHKSYRSAGARKKARRKVND